MKPPSPIAADSDKSSDDVLPEHLLTVLRRTLKDLRYGVVELVVQDGRIVQVNKTEKIRFQ
jgi:hypothetical protein